MYIPSSSGWSSQKASWGTSAAGRGHLRLNCTRSYNSTTNKSTLTFSIEAYSGYYEGNFAFQGNDTIKVNGTTVATLDNTYGVALYGSGDTTYRPVKKSGSSSAKTWTTAALSHDEDGVLSVPIKLDLTLFYTLGSTTYVLRWTDSYTFTATEPRASTISSVTTPVTTNSAIQLLMSRNNSAYYHKATLTYSGATLYESDPFATILSIPTDRSWFDSYPNAASLSCTLSVQTYTDSSCTTTMGSPVTAAVVVNPDAGMAPVLATGYATAAVYNTGTAADGCTLYVSGVSKAEVTLDSTKLTLATNATVDSISVTGGGETATSSPYRTGALVGTATITVTVTDSHGLSATQTLTVETTPYYPPSVIVNATTDVFRCNNDGTANEDGIYVSVKARAVFTSLGGWNDAAGYAALTAQLAEGGGAYGAASNLTNNQANVLGGSLDPDKTLNVWVKATDRIGNTAEFFAQIPQRFWAMKFRPDGHGVAFGMAPSEDNVLQLPTGWKIKIGTTVVAQE